MCWYSSLGGVGPLAVPAGRADAGDMKDASRRVAFYATCRAYRAAWPHFSAWRKTLSRAPLAADPYTLAMYIVRRADDGLAVSSLRVALAAIKTAHLLAGLSLDLRHPRLAMVFEGISRSERISPQRQAAQAVPALRLILAACAALEPHARRTRPGDAAARLRRRAAPLRTGRPDALFAQTERMLECQCQVHLDLQCGAQPLGQQINRLRIHQIAGFDAFLGTAFRDPVRFPVDRSLH